MAVRHSFAIIIVWLLTLPLLPGCSLSSDDDPPQLQISSENILRRGNGGDPQTLDPSLAEDVHAFNVLRDLYEGLVIEAADGSLIPGTAERWEISDDGRLYTFYLRTDARWSSGATVSAEDFVAGFQRTLAANSTSPYSFLLSPILNYAAVTNGDLPVTELGVHVVDSQTLVIELASPATHFLGVLAMPIAYPLYIGEEFDGSRFRDPDKFVGNGPYVLTERRPARRIRLQRNEMFHNASNVSVQYVDYYPIVDPATELNMYRAGELDITATVPPPRIRDLRQSQPEELWISPSLALYYLAFDLGEPPLDNLVLRKALSMAIDRRTLVELIGRGEQAAFGIVPEGVAGHQVARYDWQSTESANREAQARQHYLEAGYDGANPLQIKLTYDVGDIHETVALAVSAMWREVLGVEVTLDKREWKYFLATRDERAEWQVMRFAWVGDYNDARTFLEIFRSDSSQNLSGFDNPKYDRLLRATSETIDVEKRTELMTQAEMQLLDEYPIAPLYFYVSKHLVNPAVRNFEANILDIHPSQFLIKHKDKNVH